MNAINHPIRTAAGILVMIEAAPLPPTRKRDLISAVSRMCEVLGVHPAALKLDIPDLRKRVWAVRPAAHRISKKTWSNVRSLFQAALLMAGIIDDLGRGEARRDPDWAPLHRSIAADPRMSAGLACFMNWCTIRAIKPAEVDDEVVQRFFHWLEGKTLHPKPRDLTRGVPRLWNEARRKIDGWPTQELTRLSFRAPSEHILWKDMPPAFWAETEGYLRMRAEPDLFGNDPHTPKRPVSQRTIQQERDQIRIAASILVRNGARLEDLSLAVLTEPGSMKTVLRHYYNAAGGKPNAFVVAMARTITDLARFHVRVSDERLKELKGIASKLPAIPNDMTEKNKELIRQLECEQTRARLFFMPDKLIKKAEAALARGLLPFVDAQVAIAVDILLNAPIRPRNLASLDWLRHFKEPKGPKGHLLLYIPKAETKSGKRDLSFELPEDVARKIRWYRREIMPRLGADPYGELFVSRKGGRKKQVTLSVQTVRAIAEHVGIHMTMHQFRHLAAALYLEDHPDDFQTVSDLLGHAWQKTTLIYAGPSSRRAGRAYGSFILQQREALKLKRGRTRRKP